MLIEEMNEVSLHWGPHNLVFFAAMILSKSVIFVKSIRLGIFLLETDI